MPEKTTIAECVAILCEAFGRKPTKNTYKAYELGLEDLTDDQCRSATHLALKQAAKFMPTPAELIELARTNGVSYEAQAALSFEELENALSNNRPSLMSPVVAAVARQIGGFQRLYDMPLDEFGTWKRKDFIQTYIAITKENPERLAAIAGPRSDIAKALTSTLKKIPTREEDEKAEIENRKKLQQLPRTLAELPES